MKKKERLCFKREQTIRSYVENKFTSCN